MNPEQDPLARSSKGQALALVGWLLLAVATPAAVIWFSTPAQSPVAERAPHKQSGPTDESPDALRPEETPAAHRVRVQAWLQSYGWIDRQNGIARVPIESAMATILREGLPARAENEEQHR